MNKNLIWLALPAFLASCSLFGGDKSESSSTEQEQEEMTSIVENRVDLSDSLDSLRSGSDWGKDRSTLVAKTVEWSDVSTSAFATYLAGEVVIDKVHRDDADDFYGVSVRLGNRNSKTIDVDYLFRFYDAEGNALASLHERYRPANLLPRGTALLFDTARSRGAVGFRLFVRRKGTTNVGYADANLTWLNGPQKVTTWLNGIVFVEKVFQANPGGTNRVLFRLAAKSGEPVNVDYRITFYDGSGISISSDHDEFRPLSLSADKEAAILNTCRQSGATGYRLFVRTTGTQTGGLDDQSVPTETPNQ